MHIQYMYSVPHFSLPSSTLNVHKQLYINLSLFFLFFFLSPSLSLSRSEEQLMLTKVFFAQKRMLSSCSLNDFSESCPLPGDPGVIPKQSSQAQAQHNSSFHYSLRPPSSSPGEKNQGMFTYIRVLLQCTMGSWDCL